MFSDNSILFLEGNDYIINVGVVDLLIKLGMNSDIEYTKKLMMNF